MDKKNPKVKDVLLLIGTGSFIAASFVMPGLPLLAKPLLDKKRNEEMNAWKKFNSGRLKQILKRLHEQKIVDISETKDGYIVAITEKGKRRMLKYNFDEFSLTKKKWDKKWRIIIYDVDESKKHIRKSFQAILKKLQLFQLQKSVYLTPYSCEDEIEYLKQIHNIGREVVILTVSGFENESAYKEYFGLS